MINKYCYYSFLRWMAQGPEPWEGQGGVISMICSSKVASNNNNKKKKKTNDNNDNTLKSNSDS